MTTTTAPKAVGRFILHWTVFGFGTLGSALSVGLIPLELLASALPAIPQRIATVAAAQERTVPAPVHWI
jgi:hypothetical protein